MRRTGMYLLGFLCLTGFYYCLFAVWPRNDDNASGYLRGLDMFSGNWLLEGWRVSPDTFLFCEIPLGGLLGKLGQGPRALFQIPAICWSAVVCLALYLALAGKKSNGKIRVAFVLLFLGIPLLKESPALSILADSPIHIGCTAYMLASYGILYAYLRDTLATPLALSGYFLLSTASIASDPMMTFVAFAPILITSLGFLHRKTGRTTAHRQILTTGILAWTCSKLLLAWIQTHGMHIDSANMRFTDFGNLPHNLLLLAGTVMGFCGADFGGKQLALGSTPGLILNLLKLSYFTFGWQAWTSLKHQWQPEAGEPDYLDSLLLAAVIVGSAAFVLSANVVDASCGRYWLPAFIFLTILLARNLQATAWSGKLLWGAGFGALTLCLLSHDWKRVAHPLTTNPDQTHLITQLNERGLQDGFGTYWLCHLITVASHQQIRIRPLDDRTPPGPYLWLTSYHDYEPDQFRGPRIFVVHANSETRFNSRERFGTSLEQFQVGSIQVEVFERNEEVLKELYRQAEATWKAETK